MADELSTPPVTRVQDALSERRDLTGGGVRPRHGTGGKAGGEGGTGYGDSASVHGIPEPELTPAVQAALADLMAAIDRLRDQARQQQERIERLEQEVEDHPHLPVKNRRGLFHALHRLLPRIQEGQMTAALLVLHVGGAERLRLRHGLRASDAALRDVAEMLVEDVRQTDVVAGIGAYDFAILMPLADAEAAWEKGQALAARIQAASFRWEEQTHQLALAWGVAAVRPEQPLEETLAQAAPRAEPEPS